MEKRRKKNGGGMRRCERKMKAKKGRSGKWEQQPSEELKDMVWGRRRRRGEERW